MNKKMSMTIQYYLEKFETAKSKTIKNNHYKQDSSNAFNIFYFNISCCHEVVHQMIAYLRKLIYL